MSTSAVPLYCPLIPTKQEYPVYYRPTESHDEMMKKLYEQSLRLCTSALEHYNKKHHVDFELVEPLVSSPIVGGDGIWFHCNYKAKDRAVSSEESYGSSIKLFFSELKVVKPSNLKEGISARYKVTACRIIDGVKQITGCDYCCHKIIHPAGGFRKGLYHRDTERVSSLRPILGKRARI